MNNIFKNKKFIKNTLFVLVMLFLWISTIGLTHHLKMMENSPKNNCLFGSSKSECVMDFSEHIILWQEMFASTPQKILGAINLLFSLVVIYTISKFYKNYLLKFLIIVSSRFKLYFKHNPEIKLFDYIKNVFSKGILHPKIY